MTAILIEDEERSRRSLKALLAQLGDDVEVVGEADTVSNAVELIHRVKPDVVFMDIVLREGTGFDVLKKASGDFDLVFITAYDEYALRAFKFSAIDYLLKPIDPDDLAAALLKIRTRQRRTRTADRQLFQEMMEQKPKRPERMVVPVVDGLEVIPLRNILYCQADRNYTNIVMIDGKKLVSSKTLKHYEDMLTACDFFRVHNSYLINLGQIRKYHKTNEGIVEMNNGYKIDVARSRKGALLQAISELG